MILKNISQAWKSPDLKKKILVTLGIVVLYEFLSNLPVPGINVDALAGLKAMLANQQGLAFFSALMGGGLKNFSIVLMGLSPYINAVIIIQLLAVVIPQLEALKKEGEQGQKKMNKYTRWLTIPLAFAQSYGMIILMNQLIGSAGGAQIINTSNFLGIVLPTMITITAGTMFLVWLGEIVNEAGIGNGSSLIIFAGVLTGVPQHIMNYVLSNNYLLLGILVALTLLAIYIIIRFTEGYRKIPLIYTRTGREEKSHFPIRVNQAGMVPIIFAVSIITFPTLIAQILQKRIGDGTGKMIIDYIIANFSMQNPSWTFIVFYFLLVLGFSFFYVSIVFNTDEVAESIQKRGGYIPGIRPGKETSEFLAKTSLHLNLYGGGFLALLAVFPYIASRIAPLFINTSGAGSNIDFIISGAGLIIVVGTVLDLIRKVDTELKSYDYKRFF
jgi:preprotein translocase subunit SecY